MTEATSLPAAMCRVASRRPAAAEEGRLAICLWNSPAGSDGFGSKQLRLGCPWDYSGLHTCYRSCHSSCLTQSHSPHILTSESKAELLPLSPLLIPIRPIWSKN